jgi:hypothetical protein
VRLHRPKRPAGLIGDLAERQIAEESEGDDLAIWLIELNKGSSDVGCALRTKRGVRRVGPTGHVARAGIHRIEPDEGSPSLRAANGDSHGDARQPGSEGTVLTPRPERSEGGHECLLRSILGLVEVSKYPMAGANDGWTLALDQAPECFAVTGQDALDDRSVVGEFRLSFQAIRRKRVVASLDARTERIGRRPLTLHPVLGPEVRCSADRLGSVVTRAVVAGVIVARTAVVTGAAVVVVPVIVIRARIVVGPARIGIIGTCAIA